jgi:hypothetical protein
LQHQPSDEVNEEEAAEDDKSKQVNTLNLIVLLNRLISTKHISFSAIFPQKFKAIPDNLHLNKTVNVKFNKVELKMSSLKS